MAQRINDLGQPVGASMTDWISPSRPTRAPLEGRFCRLEALNADRHARDLFDAYAADASGYGWTYLPYGPFDRFDDYREWVITSAAGNDPLFFAIVDRYAERAVGVASYMRIDPANGVIEVGGLNFSPLLQRTPAATEAMYLMMEHAFSLGYRRYEWKCDALNEPSRRAATRLGFVFEGIFRQAVIYKGRNRDTAWFSIIDTDWPRLREAYHRWLDPANFDAHGSQKVSLSDLTIRL